MGLLQELFKAQPFNAVEGGMYKPPIELMQRAINRKDEAVDDFYKKQDALKELIPIMHLDSPEDTELANKLMDERKKKIDELAEYVRQNPGEAAHYMPKLNSLVQDIVKDQTAGTAYDVEQRLRDELEWKKTYNDIKKINPWLYNLMRDDQERQKREMYERDFPQGKYNGRIKYLWASEKPVLFTQKNLGIAQMAKANMFDAVKGKYLYRNVEISEDEAAIISAGLLADDPDFQGYARQMDKLGHKGFLDSDGNLIPLIRYNEEKKEYEVNPDSAFHDELTSFVYYLAHHQQSMSADPGMQPIYRGGGGGGSRYRSSSDDRKEQKPSGEFQTTYVKPKKITADDVLRAVDNNVSTAKITGIDETNMHPESRDKLERNNQMHKITDLMIDVAAKNNIRLGQVLLMGKKNTIGDEKLKDSDYTIDQNTGFKYISNEKFDEIVNNYDNEKLRLYFERNPGFRHILNLPMAPILRDAKDCNVFLGDASELSDNQLSNPAFSFKTDEAKKEFRELQKKYRDEENFYQKMPDGKAKDRFYETRVKPAYDAILNFLKADENEKGNKNVNLYYNLDDFLEKHINEKTSYKGDLSTLYAKIDEEDSPIRPSRGDIPIIGSRNRVDFQENINFLFNGALNYYNNNIHSTGTAVSINKEGQIALQQAFTAAGFDISKLFTAYKGGTRDEVDAQELKEIVESLQKPATGNTEMLVGFNSVYDKPFIIYRDKRSYGENESIHLIPKTAELENAIRVIGYKYPETEGAAFDLQNAEYGSYMAEFQERGYTVTDTSRNGFGDNVVIDGKNITVPIHLKAMPNPINGNYIDVFRCTQMGKMLNDDGTDVKSGLYPKPVFTAIDGKDYFKWIYGIKRMQKDNTIPSGNADLSKMTEEYYSSVVDEVNKIEQYENEQRRAGKEARQIITDIYNKYAVTVKLKDPPRPSSATLQYIPERDIPKYKEAIKDAEPIYRNAYKYMATDM